jgi:hypothetical protein
MKNVYIIDWNGRVMKCRVQQGIAKVLLMVLLVGLSGCIKYHEFVPSEFSQGTGKARPCELVRSYIKTLALYKEFTTEALFDVLWLSDAVRKEYVHTYASRRGKDAHSQQVLLQQQHAEANQWISFYILSDIRRKDHNELHDKRSGWSVYLKFADGRTIEPVHIKEVELEPEYQSFFGHRYVAFKTPYLVTFAAKDVQGVSYPVALDSFALHIASPEREGVVQWGEEQTSHVSRGDDEDFYWS